MNRQTKTTITQEIEGTFEGQIEIVSITEIAPDDDAADTGWFAKFIFDGVSCKATGQMWSGFAELTWWK